MANPVIASDQLPRRKPIGEDLNIHDSLLPVVPTNIHKTTPPSLSDGDVAVDQADDMGNKKVTLGDPAQIADLKEVEITNATIEQTTGAAHNDLNIAVAGKDASGDVQPIPITADGVKVDGSAVTQPISASALPLPSGAATEATLADCKTALQIIDNFISGSKGLVTEDNSASIKTAVEAINTALQTSGISQVQFAAMVTALQTIDNFISGSKGLVTEDNSASIKTAVETIDNFISGSRGLVTEDNSTSIKTAVEKIDDIQIPIAGPSAALVVDSYTHAAFNLTAGANQVLVSSSASHQIWVYGIGFTVNVAGTVSFQDEDDTAITGIMPIDAKGGMVVSPSGNFAMPIWKLATDKDLEVDVVTSELDGWIDYAIVNA